jgi:hypothetical protein
MKFESITVDVELDIDEIFETVFTEYSVTEVLKRDEFDINDVCLHLKANYTEEEIIDELEFDFSKIFRAMAESMSTTRILNEIDLDKNDVIDHYAEDLDNEDRARLVGLDEDDIWELAVDSRTTVQLLRDIDPEFGEIKEYLNYGHTQEAIEEFFGTKDFGKMTAKEIWDQLVDSQEEEMIEIVTSKIGYVTLWENFSKEQRSELIKMIMKTYTLQSLVDILSEEPHLRDW